MVDYLLSITKLEASVSESVQERADLQSIFVFEETPVSVILHVADWQSIDALYRAEDVIAQLVADKHFTSKSVDAVDAITQDIADVQSIFTKAELISVTSHN